MNKTEERIEWIDITRGICIIGVVVAHIFMPGTITRNFVMLFNLTTFFFLSGFLYKKGINHKSFIIRKAKSILVPYFAIFLFTYPLVAPFLLPYGLSLETFLYDTLYHAMGGIYIRSHTEHLFVPMWFMTCLFLVQIIYHFMQTYLSQRIIHISVAIMLAVSYINSIYYPDFYLYWAAQNVLAGIPIYHMGYMFKHHSSVLNRFSLFICIGGVVSILSTLILPQNIYDILINVYGIPFLTFICSIATILTLIYLSKHLSKYKFISKTLQPIGKASLIIMALNTVTYALLWKYFRINSMIALPLMLIIPFIVYLILDRFRISQILILGKR